VVSSNKGNKRVISIEPVENMDNDAYAQALI
jgi:hypothetical protein